MDADLGELGRRRRRANGEAFSPYTLFASGEQGVWYDPSDLTPEKVSWRRNLLTYSQDFENAAWTKSNASILSNLALYSQDFDNAAWAKLNATVTANTTTAPDGTTTADTMTTSGAAVIQRALQLTTLTGASTFSVYVKANTAQFVQLLQSTDSNAFANFDVGTGVAGTYGSNATSSITSVGSGWYRCQISSTIATAGNWMVYITPSNSSIYGASFTATTASLFLWGAQLVPGSTAQTYTRSLATAAPIQFADPLGGTLADKLVENATTNQHFLSQNAPTFAAGAPYTYTVYAKAAERFAFQLYGYVGAFVYYVNVNLSTKALTGAFNCTPTLTELPDGWFRVNVPFVPTASGTGYTQLYMQAVGGGSPSYTGDGVSGIYVYGAQVEQASTASAYQRITDFSSDFLAAFPTHALYQESTGVTPVTALGQSVGYVVDKRLGGLTNLGAELVTNGTFASATGWSTGGAWVIADGIASLSASAASLSQSTTPAVVGRTYLVTFTVTNYASGSIRVEFGGVNGVTRTGAGTYSQFITATTTAFLVMSPTTTSTLALDNISVREVPGNHALQATSAARPTLQARSNLLTYSEQFNNAAWTKNGGTTVTTGFVSPIGDTSAQKIIPALSGTTNGISRSLIVNLGGAFSFYAKAAEITSLTGQTGAGDVFTVDLTTGAFSGTNATRYLNAQVVNVGNGWWRVSWTRGSGNDPGVFINAASGIGGTNGFLLWGAQSEDNSTATTYQRVTTATDYADVGLPRNLTFDGVDDSLATAGNVDFATWTVGTRRNLLVNPTQFDASSWAVTQVSVTPNTAIAPDGTTTADKMVELAVASSHSVLQSVTTTAGVVYTYSVYVKKAERNFAQVRYENGGSTQLWAANVNLTDGTYTTTTFGSPTSTSVAVTDAGNGWWRVALGVSSSNTTFQCIVFSQAVQGTNSYTGDGTSGIFLWGAQLEVGSTATAFQDVGTDKVTLFSGVTKLSDAARGVVAELSATAGNPGTFYFSAPQTSGFGNYDFASGGSIPFQQATSPSSYPAPITNVLTGLGDIAGDRAILRLNGSVAQTNTADQGTGNYASALLYIGRRASTSLPFNGRLFQLVIRGAATDSVTVGNAERWVGQLTGVAL